MLRPVGASLLGGGGAVEVVHDELVPQSSDGPALLRARAWNSYFVLPERPETVRVLDEPHEPSFQPEKDPPRTLIRYPVALLPRSCAVAVICE